ncbi:MAG: phoU [Jatrophihabitans sp.]|nr:phoU [Jatrophihabitans sp.]
MSVRLTYRQSLDELWERMAGVARLDVVAVERATLALLDSNRQLAELVISEQSDIDALCLDIEAHAAALIARQQPVAGDLRLVLGAIPMSASLARMGGLAQHVAQSTRRRAPESAVVDDLRDVFATMGRTAVAMAADLATALSDRDIRAATAVREADDTMDELHRQLFAVALAPSWSQGIEPAIDAALLGRYYERFADQAVSNAERIHFILTGAYPAHT